MSIKKIILSLLSAAALVGLVACGGSGYDKTVKADADRVWVMHGQYLLADGETQNGWNAKTNELYEASKMTATSIDEVSKISKEVADTLKGKSIKHLYVGEAVFGMNDTGWTTNCMINNKLNTANGSYAFKAAACTYEAADQVYSEDQWISDAKTAHAESLTPSTFFVPVWQEAADENGFSWASNPVVIGGAGKYKMIVAQYTDVSSATTPGYGIAAVKVEDTSTDEKAQKYVEVVDYVAADHTYGVIGSFATSNWSTDVPMTAAGAGSYSAEVTLAAGDQFKVRADGAWTYKWVPAAVEGVVRVEKDNAVAVVDGTYVVTISGFNKLGNATVTVSLKTA